MKKFTLLFSLLGAVFIGHTQSPNSWVSNYASTGNMYISKIVADAAGNVYSTGSYSRTAIFDASVAFQLLTGGGKEDIFINKHDPAGNLLWVVGMGANEDDKGHDIGLDAAGNVYVTGEFRLTVDFDYSVDVHTLSTQDANDVDQFILKLDTDGNFIWANSIAADNTNYGIALKVDAAGNIYTTGTYRGPADFDPGSGTALLTAANGNFVSKYDTDGNYIWAKSLDITGGFGSRPRGLALDASNNVYITGNFSGSIDLDPGTNVAQFTTLGIDDAFIIKLDANGHYQWGKQLGGTELEMPTGIEVDAAGNVYTTGYFRGTTDFDPGIGVHDLTTNGNTDVYVSKLNANGDHQWTVQLGSTGYEYGGGIVVDAAGYVNITGNFSGTIDFGPGATLPNLVSAGDADAYLCKLDASGNFVSTASIGSTGYDYGVVITANDLGHIYLSGGFSGTVDFDPGQGDLSLTSYNPDDAFILHLVPAAPLPLTLLHFDAVDKTSTVLLQWQTIDEQNIAGFSIERSADGKTYESIGTVAAANNNKLQNSYTFTDAQPFNGTSYYRLKIADHNGPVTYSRIVPVRRQLIVQGMQVFPNPTTSVLNVQLEAHEVTTLKIVDASGRIWKQQHITIDGNTTFPIAVQNLPKGQYYIIMKGKTTQQVKAFLKK